MSNERIEMKTDTKANELNRQVLNYYERCCHELKLNPKHIQNDIEKAPSYKLYYAKCREFVNYMLERNNL
jgi:hypothetical protein